MKDTKENDKKWIQTLQERNRVLEEVLALTQLENKELTEQLRIGSVIDRFPESDYIRQQAQQMDEKEFEQWWWETFYKGN